MTPLPRESPLIVLVVEDDAATRELFGTALRAEGFAVVAVGDGVDALTYLDTHKPAAVVLDLGLPRLPGRDVLNEMAAQGLTREVPVIVVTGEPISGLDTRDFACVLNKPTSPEELIETVRRCLRNTRSR